MRLGHVDTPVHALIVGLWIARANIFLYTLGQNVFSAAFLARLPVNIADKTIAVFVAYGALRLTQRRTRPADEF